MEEKMDLVNQAALSRLGFGFGKGTIHSARTIMLDELTRLLEEVPAAQNKSDYIQAIIERNCLGKQSFNTRKRTAEHLTELYTLDPQVNLFRNLLYFWRRDEQARPLLALLCATTRDGMLRETADRILKLAEGAKPALTDMEETIETLYPGRFSARSVTSMAQNLRATWTHTGHLTGRVIKIRQRVTPTPAAAASDGSTGDSESDTSGADTSDGDSTDGSDSGDGSDNSGDSGYSDENGDNSSYDDTGEGDYDGE